MTTTDYLEKNLAALARTAPKAAEQVRCAFARTDLVWCDTSEGVPSATATDWDATGLPVQRALGSRRTPLTEAQRLTEKVDITQHPAIVVMGFALGYHVQQIAQRLGRTGVLVVYEPDTGLLRSVLERIDHSAWLGQSNVVIVSDAGDAGGLAATVQGLEEAFALGCTIVDHPPSRPRLGDGTARFMEQFTSVIRSLRTTVVTTLVQTEATIRNSTQNLDRYVTGAGIADLAGAYAGRPAIVVAAGPSLARSIELLSDPTVRERFVIIAVQTVLKTLLARGIRPHFVTALDFHEVSRRFYEGLCARDVEGVTLVIEPKVNPAVPEAFAGVIRCGADAVLDTILGPGLRREMGSITPGATVAHLAYYLARHVGCDPVILVGQDLGFTDGQYYASGAAIHDVWAGELNEFNTLEAMEWQRIVRHRSWLVKATDSLGRAVYTDEQMTTYLTQFQRDFAADATKGLTTIDASEGGVLKQHTRVMTLREAIERFGGHALAVPTDRPPPMDEPERRRRLRRCDEGVRALRRDVGRLGALCRDAGVLLGEMLEHHEDQPRVNKLIARVDALREKAQALEPAMGLVQRLNQSGALRRARADRTINVESDLDALSRQRAQIQRDIDNVRSLAQASDTLGAILDQAGASLGGAPKQTRDPMEARLSGRADRAHDRSAASAPVLGVVTMLAGTSGLGTRADALREILPGRTALHLTLSRVARVQGLAGVTVLCADAELARRAAGTLPAGLEVRYHVDAMDKLLPAGVRRAARLWSRDCWRGGLCGLTAYDEFLDPAAIAHATREARCAGAMVLGSDWCFVDPDLCSTLIERFAEDPQTHALSLCQAAPGLAPIVMGADLLTTLARGRPSAGPFASVGGLVGYVPASPARDPITRSYCVPITPGVRDALVRCIPDSSARAQWLLARLHAAGLDPLCARGEQIALALAHDTGAIEPDVSMITFELTGPEGILDAGVFDRVLGPIASRHDDCALTLAGNPLDHPHFDTLIARARALGVAAVQVRTDLVSPARVIDRLLAAGPEVISVDLHANDAQTSARLSPRTSPDAFAVSRENLQRLLEARTDPAGVGISTPWIVPRLTRCDAVYEQLEALYDHWLMTTGACVIDPLDAPIPGQRIAPLALPALARARRTLHTRCFGVDGRVIA